jgi:hypothetical protein
MSVREEFKKAMKRIYPKYDETDDSMIDRERFIGFEAGYKARDEQAKRDMEALKKKCAELVKPIYTLGSSSSLETKIIAIENIL